MRRFAWTLILLGLAAAASPTIVGMFDDEVAEDILMWPFVGMQTLLSGCVLLAATVIADAITKAQGTRESP